MAQLWQIAASFLAHQLLVGDTASPVWWIRSDLPSRKRVSYGRMVQFMQRGRYVSIRSLQLFS